ncbi:hypothetical protein PT974_05025 [Cladobotryum mycophilum]|uniref:ADF-H domain-containing protein n=1 Tax=Cladobotryum mycophilum TaxID=491253 RepID=A0ABR0SRJ1_9HYPO
MSLNGLDEPKVVEAHEAAAAEPGGWFLLKYASRDEVELLDRGTGGIVEVRNTISTYDEESPLYGFLRYRRRNVVIKYLPEDCSRLIQARVAVHFNAICERFSPYDTIFEISTATELRDTKLSAACSLHAASGSTSSSTSSLRRRRLMEIAEEDEEEQRALKRQSIVPEADGERPKTPADKTSLPYPVTLNSDLASSPEASKFSAATTSEVLNFVGVGDGPTSPAPSIEPDTYSYSLYPTGKPRVKLGPRPSASVDATIRPQTAGNFRPVSSIPAGFKLFGKGAKKGKGKDGNPATSPQEEIPEPIFPNVAASTEEDANDDSSRPGSRTGVTSPVPVPLPASTPTKPTISPEKARLMKAMQLREKRKKMAAAKAAQKLDAPVDEEKTVLDNTQEKAHEKEDDDVDDMIIEEEPEEDEAEDEAKDDAKDNADESQPQTEATDEKKRISLIPADSGVVLDSLESSVHTDEASELTQTESRAESPGVVSVEADQSTMASSLSESTEETVQAKDDTLEAEKDEKEDAVPATETVDVESNEKEEETTSIEVQDVQKVETEPVVEPIAEPVAEPAAEPVAEPVTASVTAPVVEPVAEPVAEPVEKPVAELVAEPVVEPVAEPVTASVTAPVVEPVAEPIAEPFVEPAIEPEESVKVEIAAEEKDATKTDDVPEQIAPAAIAGATLEVPEVETSKDEPAPAEPIDAQGPAEREEAPKLMVPKSKFSTQDLAAASKAGSPSHSAVVTPQLELESNPLEQKTETSQESKEQTKHPIPIKTDVVQTNLDDSMDADDSDLVDDSALIEEAKPVPLSKSPPTSSFPTPAIRAVAASDNTRTVSNPVRGNLAIPLESSQAPVRSLSSGAAFLHKVNQQQQSSNTLATKPIVGSSISQRIKALEKLSGGSVDQTRPASRERPSSTFFSVQKRETSRSPSVADRAKSLKGPPSPEQSLTSSPEMSRGGRKRSPSTASRFSKFEVPTSASLATASQPRGRPESISVTAKIIRDPQSQESSKDASEYNYLNLKQSPLVVDHHAVESDDSERRSGSLERDAKDGKRSSMSIVRGFIREHRKSVTTSADVQQALGSGAPTSRPSSSTQNNVASHRLSISSRRSSISKDRDNALLPSAIADDDKSGDKVMSRAGRFMRRLSNFSGARGKGTVSLASPVAEEGPSIGSKRPPAAAAGSASVLSDMGDVNVQFPDNLLWKRRNLCLDSQGFLILSASSQNGKPAVGTKRYHLSEFRQPYTPDVEVQELPNSVVLDFVEGAGIQLACEDRAGQLNVLKVLRDAHTGHSTFGR